MKRETTAAPALMGASVRSAAPRTTVLPQAGEDSIFLRGLRVEALIGVYEHERHAPQPLLIDLELGLAHSRACFSDQLHDAVDYGAVVAAVQRLAQCNRYELLEAFAQSVADALLGSFAIVSVALSVSKPGIFEVVDSAGVSIRRRRA